MENHIVLKYDMVYLWKLRRLSIAKGRQRYLAAQERSAPQYFTEKTAAAAISNTAETSTREAPSLNKHDQNRY